MGTCGLYRDYSFIMGSIRIIKVKAFALVRPMS